MGHFVSLLVLGGRHGAHVGARHHHPMAEPAGLLEPASMADARMIAESNLNSETLQCIAQTELRNVTIIVLCDLSRVEVTGIAVGTDYLTFEGPNCPVAFARVIHPGVLVRAMVRPRASEK